MFSFVYSRSCLKSRVPKFHPIKKRVFSSVSSLSMTRASTVLIKWIDPKVILNPPNKDHIMPLLYQSWIGIEHCDIANKCTYCDQADIHLGR